RIRVGDADVFVTGAQAYRIRYTLRGALSAFEGHDELYWNITGSGWPVPLEQVTTTVTLPRGADTFADCFAGITDDQCRTSADGNRATFAATRTLFPGEELTVAVGWQKGIVAVQVPVLEDRMSVDDF